MTDTPHTKKSSLTHSYSFSTASKTADPVQEAKGDGRLRVGEMLVIQECYSFQSEQAELTQVVGDTGGSARDTKDAR